MLDPNYIRKNPELVKKSSQNKRVDPKIIDDWLKADKKARELLFKTEALRQEKNKITQAQKNEGKKIKEKLKKLEPELKKYQQQALDLLKQIPNLAQEDVPPGKDESENEIIKKWGDIPKFAFLAKDHLELGRTLGLIDIDRAVKVSGSRFAYLKRDLVMLELALINYCLEFLLQEGFTPILPPALTKPEIFHKLGYSEHGENEQYYLVYDPNKEKPKEGNNYYLIGTAEHALVPMYMNEILSFKELPKRLVGFSPSFRREAGTYGKDTKGIFRVHQFDKVEMVSFTTTEDSQKEQQNLLYFAEKLVQGLKIPYRMVQMCTGELGFPAASKYDLECWLPSQEKYRETHSVSNTTDFQSRALNIKYKDQQNKINYVHILNGTALAMSRIFIAILENFQQKDGSVKIPEALRKYFDKEAIARA